jgi:hypothetical protein
MMLQVFWRGNYPSTLRGYFLGIEDFLCKSETDEGCGGATLIQSARGSHNYLNRRCSFAEEVLHLWQLRRTAVWGKRCWIFS